eukprot:8159215-Pyramimonas_sp.AAC.1
MSLNGGFHLERGAGLQAVQLPHFTGGAHGHLPLPHVRHDLPQVRGPAHGRQPAARPHPGAGGERGALPRQVAGKDPRALPPLLRRRHPGGRQPRAAGACPFKGSGFLGLGINNNNE